MLGIHIIKMNEVEIRLSLLLETLVQVAVINLLTIKNVYYIQMYLYLRIYS